MLRVNNLDFYYGHAQALYGINLRAQRGRITAVLGSNGAGKSTLLRCISGIIKAAHGTIILEDQPIENLPPHKIVELGLIQVPEGRKIFPSLTVQGNLEMGSMHSQAKKRRVETLEYVYNMFPRLAERRAQLAETLSGGEQQMLAIGRALMGLPRVLLLDEPSVGLAPLVVKHVFETIRKIFETGGTILLVEQNMHVSLALSKWAYIIENGRVVLEGTSEKLLADERTIKAYLGVYGKTQKEGGKVS